jgi:hypothetical protein
MLTENTKNRWPKWPGILLLAFIVGTLLLYNPPKVFAQSSQRAFTLGPPGVSSDQSNLLRIAAQLNNTSNTTASKIKIDSIRLDSAPLLTSTPLAVGEINAGRSAIVQANFNSSQLRPGKQYQLVIKGSYQTIHKGKDGAQKDEDKEGRDKDYNGKGKRREFIVKSVLVLPPTEPGSASVNTTGTVQEHKVKDAPFPQQPPQFDEDEVNKAAPPVPTAPSVPGTPTSTSTGITPVLSDDLTNQKALEPPSVIFNVNNGLGINGSTTAEPSGAATGGGVVFVSANWFASYSTDGGRTFTQLNPTTIFPNDVVGFCCDQIVQYVPSIDRFVWLLQGNGYRLATASPTDIINSRGTAWTYWNLTPQVFREPTSTSFDYPDLSVGNNALYISWDSQRSTASGFQVARTSLAGLQAGGTITLDYTDPANGPLSITWGDHLTQNTLDEIFWAGHNGNNKLRVFSLAEGSNTYFWRDIGISSWANNAPTSTTPDGQDWLAKNFNGPGGNTFPRNGIIGATRSANQLWFAWSAGTDSNFKQPHVEMVTLDRNNNFSKSQQVQIWNNSYAFAYPALATNACTGEVGLSFEYGGNGNYENHVVGFWGDFVAYITTGSDVGTNRFGDYVTIRQVPATESDPGNLFAAFGYGLNKVPSPGTGTNTDIRYVQFGRPSSSCQIVR